MDHRFVLPAEVRAILKELPLRSKILYDTMLEFDVHEDWDQPGEFVVATIKAKKSDIIRKSGVKERSFFGSAFPKLISSGLVRDDKHGSITLLKYKHKNESQNSYAEILALVKEQSKKIDDLTELVKRILDGQFSTSVQISYITKLLEARPVVKTPDTQSGTPPVEKEKVNSNSNGDVTPDAMADCFFELVKSTEHRSDIIVKADDFLAVCDQEDRKYIIPAMRNIYNKRKSSDKPKFFKFFTNGLLSEIDVIKGEEAKKDRVNKTEQLKQDERQSFLDEEKEIKRMDERIKSLSQEQRSELRANAIEEIKKTIKNEALITEILIQAKERELLRKQMFDEETQKD